MSAAADSDSEYNGAGGTYMGYGSAIQGFPVHDACEFHDAEFLRKLIFVQRDDNSSVSDSSDSSSDEDDDSAAAAAAVTGIPQTPSNPPADSKIDTTEETQPHDAAAANNNGESNGNGLLISPATKKEQKEPNEENNVDGDVDGDGENEKKDEFTNNANGSSEIPKNNGLLEKMEVDTTAESIIAENETETKTLEGDKAETTTEVDVENISPVKLGPNNISTPAKSNAELLEKLGVTLPQEIKAAATAAATDENNINTYTEEENKSEYKQEDNGEKEQKQKKVKEPRFYCPHSLDSRDTDENTPLHVAIHHCKIEHIRLLLEAGADCHRKCDGSAPIHTVISIGAITAHKGFAYDAVVLLQKFGADLTCRDEALHTPLYLSAVYNLPSIAGLILNDVEGKQTLNFRSDRSGGRPLHAAAKFDLSRGKKTALKRAGSNGVGNENIAAVTQLLLGAPGIEVDAKNNFGRTPLHLAASFGNWQVVRLLLKAGADPTLKDQRGFTPGGLAYKRGMSVPSDLTSRLGEYNSGIPTYLESSSSMPPKRELMIDPDQPTFLVCHELCSQHFTCGPIVRNPELDVPPENVKRLKVLLDQTNGILRCSEFDGCKWEAEARRATMSDVLKIHEYTYIENIQRLCNLIPNNPHCIGHLDGDTGISRWSFEAALRAAGSVCDAVDRIMAGDYRNAFCAVRPPGHHAGPRGVVRCPNDSEGSHGFCLLNNIAIGAAYARSMYRNDGIKKVAIIDFDVHHGNGTEAIIRQLSPTIEKTNIKLPFATGSFETPRYKPWLDETDIDNVFFASTHGYGPRGRPESDFDDLEPHMAGWFYPGSGKSYMSESFVSPVETPDLNEFILSETWTRMGEETKMNCGKVINVGLGLPKPGDVPGMQRVEIRDSYRKQILPNLLNFDPDIIFISAGFDGHRRDTMNYGYVGMVEEDFEWLTDQLVRVANTCCNGRIVSVLEGGYRIHGGIVSPFARSVASHVRSLVEGGHSRELYDKVEAEWDSKYERRMVEERERKRQLRLERYSQSCNPHREMRRDFGAVVANAIASNLTHYDMDAIMKEPLSQGGMEETPQETTHAMETAADEEQPRKRRRNAVDYKELYEQLRKEGNV